MPLFGPSPRFITQPPELSAAERIAQQVAAIEAGLRAQAALPHGQRNQVLINAHLDQLLLLRPERAA